MNIEAFNQELFIATTFFFYIFVLRNALYWLYLWQVKEYRLDRILIHIKETNQGKNLLFAWSNFFKVILIVFYFYTSIDTSYSSFFHPLVFGLYSYETFKVLVEIKNRKLPLPKLTPRIILTYGLTLIVIFILYVFYIVDRFLWFILLDKIVPFIVSAFIGVFSIPSDFYRDLVINRAIGKISRHKKLLVIGVTGSYGKGSTKEYMSQILSYKFNVLKTQGTYNTPIGIARTILSGLTGKKEVFIVEMGAYKRGDIRDMCSIVKPTIGVLTAVNDQHISLFGSLKNIIQTKYELVEYLPKDGLSLFNGNNVSTQSMYKKTKKKKILYLTNYSNSASAADIEARNISVGKTTLTFDVIFRAKNMGKVSVHLLGAHNIENLLPGIFLGFHLGMKNSEIKLVLGKIKPLKKTMQPYISSNQAFLVDDTFNANPAAVTAALEYTKVFRGKKIFVLQPMIELGNNAKNDHYQVAKEIGIVCDRLVLTNRNFFNSIQKGILDSGGKCELSVLPPLQISRIVGKMSRGDVAVFEGKESAFSLALIDKIEV